MQDINIEDIIEAIEIIYIGSDDLKMKSKLQETKIIKNLNKRLEWKLF